MRVLAARDSFENVAKMRHGSIPCKQGVWDPVSWFPSGDVMRPDFARSMRWGIARRITT